MVPSWPYQVVGVEATTIDCASIILPITPPDELAAPIRTDERPSCSEVIFCRLPNRMLDAVSDPVSATPSQPSSVPNAISAEIVISEIAHSLMVRPYSAIILVGEKPIRKPETIAAISMPVPVNDRYVNANTALSGVGFAATGGTLLIILCRSGTG